MLSYVSLPRLGGALKNFTDLASMAMEILRHRRAIARTVRRLDLEAMINAAGGLSDDRKANFDLLIGWALPVLVSAYCQLNHQVLSVDQREAITLLCALTAPYDDLFDEERISEERLHRLLSDASYTPATIHERLTRSIYEKLRTLPPARGNAAFDAAMCELHVAQLDSVHRLGPSSPIELAEAVTDAKSHATQRATFALLRDRISPEESVAEAAVGVWIQLIDDAIDRREDRAEGHKTLFTECERFVDVAKILERRRIEFFDRYRALRGFEPRTVETFLFRWYVVGVGALTYLYLEEQVERGVRPAIRVLDALTLVCKLIAQYSVDASSRPIEFPGAVTANAREGA